MKAFWISLLVLGLGITSIAGAASAPLAEVDGVAITADEVEKPLASQLSKLEEQIYDLKRQRLEALINEKLLAKESAKRKLTVPALLDAEVTAKVGLVTEQEIEKFYQDNKAQIKGEQAQVREQIRAFLQNQKLAAKREEFLKSLRSQAKVVVNLKAPPIQRIEVSVQGAPFKGGEKAAVTIVEFSDFHCPFCRQVISTLVKLESQYGEKIKLVFRDFPIENLHPGATKAHEAARCATEQGKFWPYHDKLFASAPSSSPDVFKGIAKEVGLDAVIFETCLGSGKYQAAIKEDIAEGNRVGVGGTPAFFVNGRLISGAQPFEAFARVIDDELSRTAASRKASE
jgi:protein-disulfide isomerase